MATITAAMKKIKLSAEQNNLKEALKMKVLSASLLSDLTFLSKHQDLVSYF